jgi:hypothetical protein
MKKVLNHRPRPNASDPTEYTDQTKAMDDSENLTARSKAGAKVRASTGHGAGEESDAQTEVCPLTIGGKIWAFELIAQQTVAVLTSMLK